MNCRKRTVAIPIAIVVVVVLLVVVVVVVTAPPIVGRNSRVLPIELVRRLGNVVRSSETTEMLLLL
jgi:hypothetical protein